MTAERIDEETPLIANSNVNNDNKRKRQRTPTPLPKMQISILLLLQICEPITSQVIYPVFPQAYTDEVFLTIANPFIRILTNS